MNYTTINHEGNILCVSSLYPTTALDPKNGYFYKVSGTQVIRRLLSDSDGFIWVYLKDETKTKRRPLKLAWEVLNNIQIPDGYSVYAKNLDYDDWSAYNLALIKDDEYKKLRDCLKNLEGALKVNPSSKSHCAVLHFILDGKKMRQQYNDITAARKAKNKILVYCTKFIAKYTMTK